MRRSAVWVLVGALAPGWGLAAPGIKINEFLPNPPDTDGTKEWVELYNSGSTAVDIAGY